MGGTNWCRLSPSSPTMENPPRSGLLLSASEPLKLAVAQERRKPQYATTEHDACLTLWLAHSVRRNNPAAFDLNNPADRMIWVFVGTE